MYLADYIFSRVSIITDQVLFISNLDLQAPPCQASLCKFEGANPRAEACFLDKHLQLLYDECKRLSVN